jgi:large subunit ribosomal protein L30e
MTLKDLRDALKENKLVIGTERTIKNLKKGKVKEVFMAKNCPEHIKKQVRHYCKISKTTLTELDKTNEELGVLCKKPFSINICHY